MRKRAIALAAWLTLATHAACYSPTASNGADAAIIGDAALQITWPVRYVPADKASSVGTVDLSIVVPTAATAIWDLSTGKITANGLLLGEAPVAVAAAQIDGPTLQVVQLRGLKMTGGIVELRGVGPAVIVADLIIVDSSATLSVDGKSGVAGVNTGIGNGPDSVEHGGGGGGFGVTGGATLVGGGSGGGLAYSIASTFRGGSHGGRDPQCPSGSTSFGGAGGGAVLLYARTRLTLLGVISANGGGGIGGQQCTTGLYGEGGGGGGSGGAIVLQAPVIEGGSGSVIGRLYATGGGGGGGGPGQTGLSEFPGKDGNAGASQGGAGGSGGIYAAKGGSGGSTGSLLPGGSAAGTHYTSGNMGYGGGGGAGGAYGYIELRTRSSPTVLSAPSAVTIVDGP